MRMIYHHHQPYAWPSCPSLCEEGFTADWKQWCSCPVLYFILSPEYVRLLPSFCEQYWGGVMGRQPTNLAPVTLSAVTHTLIDFGSWKSRALHVMKAFQQVSNFKCFKKILNLDTVVKKIILFT